MNELLKVENLSVKYGDNIVVENVSFSLKNGETLMIIGPNGSGKTTLFKALIGVVKYTGSIKLRDGAILSYVPQKIDIVRGIPVSVREFLSLSFSGESKNYKIGEKDFEKSVLSVNLPLTILRKSIGSLSAGQLQRVLIAFALLRDPDIILFDEPTANIDIEGQETIYQILSKLQKERGFGMILISHDLSVVYRYADNVLCLNKKLVCFGPPQKALTPEEIERLYGGERGFYKIKEGK